jgi:hypothetical protein
LKTLRAAEGEIYNNIRIIEWGLLEEQGTSATYRVPKN